MATKTRKELKYEIANYLSALGFNRAFIAKACQFIREIGNYAVAINNQGDEYLIEAVVEKFGPKLQSEILKFLKEYILIERETQEHLKSQRWWVKNDLSVLGEIAVAESFVIIRPYKFCKTIAKRIPKSARQFSGPLDIAGKDPWCYECAVDDLEKIRESFPDYEIIYHPECDRRFDQTDKKNPNLGGA